MNWGKFFPPHGRQQCYQEVLRVVKRRMPPRPSNCHALSGTAIVVVSPGVGMLMSVLYAMEPMGGGLLCTLGEHLKRKWQETRVKGLLTFSATQEKER